VKTSKTAPPGRPAVGRRIGFSSSRTVSPPTPTCGRRASRRAPDVSSIGTRHEVGPRGHDPSGASAAISDQPPGPRPARRRRGPPTGVREAKATFARTATVAGRSSSSRSPGDLPPHREGRRVGVAVGDVRPAEAEALAPGIEVDRFDVAQADVDPPLADPRPAHAGEVGLAADLQGEAAVEQVIPAVPLGRPGRVHGADEVAEILGDRHRDLHRPDAVHLRDRVIRQRLGGPLVAGLQLRAGEHPVPVGIDRREVDGQERPGGGDLIRLRDRAGNYAKGSSKIASRDKFTAKASTECLPDLKADRALNQPNSPIPD